MKIEILEFKAHQKNTLQGFVDLLIVDVGLQLKGCTLHEKGGKQWIGLPARPYEKDGAQAWARIVDFPEKEDYRAFQDAAMNALREYQAGQPGRAPQAQEPADIPF